MTDTIMTALGYALLAAMVVLTVIVEIRRRSRK